MYLYHLTIRVPSNNGLVERGHYPLRRVLLKRAHSDSGEFYHVLFVERVSSRHSLEAHRMVYGVLRLRAVQMGWEETQWGHSRRVLGDATDAGSSHTRRDNEQKDDLRPE